MNQTGSRSCLMLATALVGCLALVSAKLASAHAFAPALLQLTQEASGLVDVRWKEPVARVTGSALEPVLPENCASAGDLDMRSEGTGMVAQWTLDCPDGLAGKTVGIKGLAGSGANGLVRIAFEDGRSVRAIVTPDEPMVEIPARESPLAVLKSYGALGLEHILSGIDHLLFVLGLMLLVGTGRKLFWTVTAFTLGHSLTLVLAALGVVHVPQAPVEAAIALSIVVLALEITRHSTGSRKTVVREFPSLMAGAFGLLHGLGFAGALTEIGLPQVDIPLALFAFNVGIEIGQLLFIAATLCLWLLVRRICWSLLPKQAHLIPAYAIGSLAAFWFIERSWQAVAGWGLGVS